MGGVVINLLPLIIATAVLPLWIIIVLLLLRGTGGLGKGAAFVAGVMIGRFAQGTLFALIIVSSDEMKTAEGSSIVMSLLLLMLGLIMLIAAVRKWLKEEDLDAPPPKWMETLTNLTAPRAFGLGLLLMGIAIKQWVFTISAVGIIEAAQLSTSENIIAFLIFILGTSALMLAPVLARALAPTQSDRILTAALTALERYNRPIMIIVGLVFGIYFLWKGITGLTG